MNAQPAWNSLEVAKFFASLATPIIVALIGLWINRRLNAQDRRMKEAHDDRQKKLDAEEQEKKDRRQADEDEFRRRNAPHIELGLDCQFHGIRDGNYLATLTVSARNAGEILHESKRILLRVRGIKDEPFTYLNESTPRAAFPHEVLKTNLVPWRFVFVEPGVTQHVSLTTPIPADYTYLLAHVEFEYKENWPHTSEAVFAVPAMAQ